MRSLEYRIQRRVRNLLHFTYFLEHELAGLFKYLYFLILRIFVSYFSILLKIHLSKRLSIVKFIKLLCVL